VHVVGNDSVHELLETKKQNIVEARLMHGDGHNMVALFAFAVV
jgi:hypothetical protein